MMEEEVMKGELLEELMAEAEHLTEAAIQFRRPRRTVTQNIRLLLFQPRTFLRSYQMFQWISKAKFFRITRKALTEGNLVVGYVNSMYFNVAYHPSIQTFLNQHVRAGTLEISIPRMLSSLPALQEMEKKDEDLMDLQLFLESVAKEELSVLDNMIANGEIIFDGLWRVFGKGRRLVQTDHEGELRGSLIREASYGSRIFNIISTSVSTTGTELIPIEKTTCVLGYEGLKDFSTFSIRPPTEEEYAMLYQRGKMFQKVALGFHYKSYNGLMIYHTEWATEKFEANGRVMVDAENFARFNSDYPSWSDFQIQAQKKNESNQSIPPPLFQKAGRGKRPAIRQPNRVQQVQEQVIPQDSGKLNQELKDEEIFSCVPFVPGFSFQRKRWGFIQVKSLSEVMYDHQAFDRIVMEDSRKKFIKGLLEQSHECFTDIITGKGGGSVLLLYGPPGTGKTLTAEATADLLEKPLYSISVGELGIRPLDLEKRLRQIMELARGWGAVVLIDEADIFMEKRTTQEIKRNAMVGIFLRLLEYNQSVLFLTSNRVSSFDEAFRSRISAALHFEILDQESRKKVFQNLCEAANITGIMDYDALSQFELNGREIRSSIRLALSLSISEKVPVSMEHFMKAINFALQFEKDIKEMLDETPKFQNLF